MLIFVDPAVTEPKVTFQTDTYASSQILFKATGPYFGCCCELRSNETTLYLRKDLADGKREVDEVLSPDPVKS
jgi:hypothetical protein